MNIIFRRLGRLRIVLALLLNTITIVGGARIISLNLRLDRIVFGSLALPQFAFLRVRILRLRVLEIAKFHSQRNGTKLVSKSKGLISITCYTLGGSLEEMAEQVSFPLPFGAAFRFRALLSKGGPFKLTSPLAEAGSETDDSSRAFPNSTLFAVKLRPNPA